MTLTELQEAAAEMISAVGYPGDVCINSLAGGANNRVFRVEVEGRPRAVLKVYFSHPDDSRDRLRSEFCFSSYAWDHGVRALPQPLAWDPQRHLGLYEFVEGSRLTPSEVTEGAVREALAFCAEVNQHRDSPQAGLLPQASEACFTLPAHLRTVERRLQRLQALEACSPAERDAASFVGGELSGAWSSVLAAMGREASDPLELETELPQQDRCISASDFGFHNAILATDGRLRFIDFEYAGWDDPAKMVCDFFCQPAVPVAMDYYDEFARAIVARLSDPEAHLRRIALLLPVYRVKWCCILLNEFLPAGDSRRRFADSSTDPEQRKAAQLEKARQALHSMVAS